MAEVERWLEAVQELLSRDATRSTDTHSLQEELSHCKVRRTHSLRWHNMRNTDPLHATNVRPLIWIRLNKTYLTVSIESKLCCRIM